MLLIKNFLANPALLSLCILVLVVCTFVLENMVTNARKEAKVARMTRASVMENYDELVKDQSKWLDDMQKTIDETAKLYNDQVSMNKSLRTNLDTVRDKLQILQGENNRLNGLLGKRVDPPSSFGSVKDNDVADNEYRTKNSFSGGITKEFKGN